LVVKGVRLLRRNKVFPQAALPGEAGDRAS
jgi:hypothetical protein